MQRLIQALRTQGQAALACRVLNLIVKASKSRDKQGFGFPFTAVSDIGFTMIVDHINQDRERFWVIITDPKNRVVVKEPLETRFAAYEGRYVPLFQLGDVIQGRDKPKFIAPKDVLRIYKQFGKFKVEE